MVHSFLLVGQSNAAGRGFLTDVEPIVNKQCFTLRNGRWRGMYAPINPDRSSAGANLAESFADIYARERDVNVGIIACADGGTCIDQWAPGTQLFEHAVAQAKLAERISTIAGIIWHQGESDSREGRYDVYEGKLLKLIDGFRDRLGLHDVPFLLGGLGDYLVNYPPPKFEKWDYINNVMKKVATMRERVGYVPADGLKPNADNLHFSAPALREFGIRYYYEFLKQEDKNKVYEEKPMDGVIITDEIELL